MPQKPKVPLTPEAAYLKLESWCARAERSPLQVQRKALAYGLTPPEASSLCLRLQEQGFIQPERFLAAFVREKARIAGWGPQKVAYALRSQHGISGPEVAAALAEHWPTTEANERLLADFRRKWAEIQRRHPAKPLYHQKQLLFAAFARKGNSLTTLEAVWQQLQTAP
jgi:regulatory protein